MRVTLDLIRKKSEHHDGPLSEMVELSLHQLKIEKIEAFSRVCHRLQILYLQNNLISKIENLKRMKDLRYLNLALNNITKLEGLASCEKINKLDFTVNFIDVDNMESSITHLANLQFLADLYFTGNPMCQVEGYRKYVIAMLPALTKLDGKEITKSERILAKQEFKAIQEGIRAAAATMRAEKGAENAEESEEESNDEDDDEMPSIDTDDFNGYKKKMEKQVKYTPESRYQMYKEEEEYDAKREKERRDGQKFNPQKDEMKEAKDRLNVKAVEGADGSRPRQRNVPKYEFSIKEDGKGNILADISVPKFMDTSLIDVDVHPRWFQAICKGKNILLHLDKEVLSERARVQRILANGHLHIIMPIANYVAPLSASIKRPDKAKQAAASQAADFRHIAKNSPASVGKVTDLMKEVSVSRSEGLEKARLDREASTLASQNRAQKVEETKTYPTRDEEESDFSDDSDCPPLD